ncbi:MAG TPA: primosomal protein N' [Candidatus Sulfotelmatobacter sp.]|nr:primosomal protein N' [Candidatus Sulfotelmatobacter sp.]
MPLFCDVALPVPIDRAFTYSFEDGRGEPVIGGRVLVPFRREQLQGVVIALSDRLISGNGSAAPGGSPTTIRPVLRVLDREPVLSEHLLQLGFWIAEYYLAPIGEVLRTMLPLAAEVRREVAYSISARGAAILETPHQQRFDANPRDAADRTVLEFLAEHGQSRAATLRTKVSASAALLHRLVADRLIERESTAAPSVPRTVRIAVLVPDARLPKLNQNQQHLLAALASADGRLPVSEIRQLAIPDSTLATLVRRELVRIVEIPADGAEDFLDGFALSRDLPSSSVPVEAMLNDQQRETVLQIAASVHSRKFQPFLLHGVTGSGKTAVYIAAMRRALDAGLSSLLLVPEIGLTPAMLAQLRFTFGDQVALLHSALTGIDRTAQWHRIRRGEARVVVGTRSAVFAPIDDLALIVIDEEHDTSYKQAELPRYHARDVAVMRAKFAGATVVLGSATPSLESWANVDRGKYSLLTLKQRVGNRPLPEVSLIDMRQEFAETGQDLLVSRAMTTEIEATLARGEQAILLLNRRGYSFVAMCRACGETLECENCAIALTHHKSAAEDDLRAPIHQRMECHYCGFRRTVPKHCPKCESEHVYFFGVGSQQGEEKLQQLFPHARIARMDRDTMRGHRDYERILARLHSGEINLLVGTQMIAKGHDIHGVTLVGVVGADTALGLPDFRAAERTFQLLTQVAGRAGRGQSPGKVILQTYFQDHYAVQFAAHHDFIGFYEKELQFRNWMHYPPYSALANVLVRSDNLDDALTWSGKLGKWFNETRHEGVRVLGPAAAPIMRLKRDYRYHFVLKSPSREKLNTTLRAMLAHAVQQKIPRTQVIVDVDALWLM